MDVIVGCQCLGFQMSVLQSYYAISVLISLWFLINDVSQGPHWCTLMEFVRMEVTMHISENILKDFLPLYQPFLAVLKCAQLLWTQFFFFFFFLKKKNCVHDNKLAITEGNHNALHF